MITYLINLLTFARIIIAIVIFGLLTLDNYYIFALILFFIASLSDYFDGFLARKYNATSQIGEIMDPIADKILIVFILLGLSVNLSSYLIGFVSACIISREIWVSALRDMNARNNNIQATKVIFLAKIKTSVQLFTISIYLLGLAMNNMLIVVISDFFLVMSLFVTIYTGIIYTMNSFKHF